MKKRPVASLSQIQKTIRVRNVELTITAEKLDRHAWIARIENQRGTRTEWFEPFKTAERALQAATDAIVEEGVEAFDSVQEFACVDMLADKLH